MKYYESNGILIAKVPVQDFKIVLYDGKKKSMGKDNFTMPAGHLVCDFAATSPHTRKYCGEWGKLHGDRFTFDAGKLKYMNQFYGKSVSTLMVKNGRAQVNDMTILPEGCSYAIAGIPVVRRGQDVKFSTYVRNQGWTGSELYGTWHIFLGIKAASADTVYVMAMKTKTGNMILSAEAYEKFKALGFYDVIKLDGGGSFYFNAAGKTKSTLENRRVCTIIDLGKNDSNPYPVPTRALTQGKKGNDVAWLQWELTDHGYPCDIDGSFGPATAKQLIAYQADHGLDPDGSCGPATRASLLD